MSDLLGGDFSSSFHKSNDDEIDFDAAASAFPDISLDGSTELPSAPAFNAGRTNSGFSFEDFDSSPPHQQTTVTVTGDDEIDKFESEFPDIEVPSVSILIYSIYRRALGRWGVFWMHVFFIYAPSVLRSNPLHSTHISTNTYQSQYSAPQQPSYTATFAPQPQPSAFSSTPILNQTIEDEPQVIKYAVHRPPPVPCY